MIILISFVLDTNDKGEPSLDARIKVGWMDKRMGDSECDGKLMIDGWDGRLMIDG